MEYEPAIRAVSFFVVLAAMAVWERIAPRRTLQARVWLRWLSNLGLVAVNTIAVRIAFALGAVSVAIVAEDRGWGLFNNLDLPAWLSVTLAVIALDLAIYLQHVLFHAVPALWRLHMVHHADLDIDVTTGVRFHTIEIVLSMLIKATAVGLLGAPPLAVLIFEVLLNATTMFNHSNIRLHTNADRVLRLFVVTPDMHRVHHSIITRETNSNFGFNLPWWDFLLGTYRSQPAEGHDRMTIGLAQFRDERVERLDQMLALPFVGRLGPYPIGSRSGAHAADEPVEPVDVSSADPRSSNRPPAPV